MLLIVTQFVDGFTPPVSAQMPKQVQQKAISLIKRSVAEDQKNFDTKVLEIRQQATALGMTPFLNELDQFQTEANLLDPVYEGRDENYFITIPRLPVTKKADIPLGIPAADRAIQVIYRNELRDLAQKCYLYSQRARKANSPSYSFKLVILALHYDSDHELSRKLLGYIPYEDRWITQFQKDQFNMSRVDHEIYGWLPKNYVSRYENGERYNKGQWVTAEKELENRRDFQNAWVITTENFNVKTNVSLERGVAVARALEDFYYFFRCVCTAFYSTPDQSRGLFQSNRSNQNRYDVHLFRTKEEYVNTLKHQFTQIALTNGLYYQHNRTAYFFDQEGDAFWETLFHEATHQLMYESSMERRTPGDRAFFWPVEGIACYMESFERNPNSFSVGNPRNIRIQHARYAALVENKYIGLRDFSSYGSIPFQQDPLIENLQLRYNQSSGLSHFFMHYGDGLYRDAFLEHLSMIYSGNPRVRENVSELPELLGVPYSELDRQYLEYLATQSVKYDRKPVIGNNP